MFNLNNSILFQAQKIILNNGQTINYVKVGNGLHNILCLPGALGTIWSDFKPQVEELNRSNFTVLCWDPPGYGFSRPPDRNFTTKFYENDADQAFQFMKVNKYLKYCSFKIVFVVTILCALSFETLCMHF